jgi:cell wall assembly regulator SMI1
MQKFTRALTREVEVSGERLAVTFAAEGVSVRPVGSRRPPATLSWAGLLVAAGQGEPVADQLAAALAALKGPAAKRAASPPAPAPAPPEQPPAPPPSGQPDLPALLGRLDAWLRQHRPRYHAGLRPGASPDDLAALEQALGFSLPPELGEWLGWHDGQGEEMIGSFRDNWMLLGARDIAALYRDLVADPSAGWRREWVPLLDDDQGDYTALDTQADGRPIREVWRGRQDHAPVAPSLAPWVTAFVTDVEAGRYAEDPERGEFLRRETPAGGVVSELKDG